MHALKLLATGDQDKFHVAMHELHHHHGRHSGKGHSGKGLGSMRGMFHWHGGKGACKGKGNSRHDKCMKKSGRGSKKETCTTDQGDDFKETFTVVDPIKDELHHLNLEDDPCQELVQDEQEDQSKEAAANADAEAEDSRFFENISQLLAMGFNEDEAQSALDACDDNVDEAIAMLLCDW